MIDVYFNNAAEWSGDSPMNINYKEMREMLFGAKDSNKIIQLIVGVSVFRLLGLLVEAYLKWGSHVDYICA